MNAAQPNGFGRPVATPEQPHRTIPFDYAFRFDLTGEPGNVLNSTVEVSIEADFTAVSIGYGVIPAAQPIVFGLPPPVARPTPVPAARPTPIPAAGSTPPPAVSPTRPAVNLFSTFHSDIIETLSRKFDELPKFVKGIPQKVPLGPKTAAVLRGGFRLNPQFAEQILITGGDKLDERILQEAFQAVGAPPEQIAFLYAIFDQGSGREYQNRPILASSGLGSADGKRPFRYFARPIELPARSVIRVEITEVSVFKGELHISLQGYKTLGQPGTPTGTQRDRRRLRR